MQKLITDYYNIMPKSIALQIYQGIYNFIKKNSYSQKIIITNYTQKLITDYYLFINTDKIKHYATNFQQPLITKFYHKN